VWALVIGPLASTALKAALAWVLSGWMPQVILSRSVLRSLLQFSSWMMGAHLLTWLFLYADNAIAGYFLGDAGLGLYSLGFNLSNLLPGLIIPALSAVAYPAFCALQNNRLEVGHGMLQLQSLAAAVLLPVAFGLSSIAPVVVSLIYGTKWDGLGTVIRFLAIMPGISHLWSLNADALRSIGRPDAWTKLALATLAFMIPALIFAGGHGLKTFTVVRFGSHFVYPVLSVLVARWVLRLSLLSQIRALWSSCLASGVMYGLVLVAIAALPPFRGLMGWAQLLCVIVFAACSYVSLLWLWDRGLLYRLLGAVRRVAH
jgi:O-antigen/teichoic acid export membrane protein